MTKSSEDPACTLHYMRPPFTLQLTPRYLHVLERQVVCAYQVLFIILLDFA